MNHMRSMFIALGVAGIACGVGIAAQQLGTDRGAHEATKPKTEAMWLRVGQLHKQIIESEVMAQQEHSSAPRAPGRQSDLTGEQQSDRPEGVQSGQQGRQESEADQPREGRRFSRGSRTDALWKQVGELYHEVVSLKVNGAPEVERSKNSPETSQPGGAQEQPRQTRTQGSATTADARIDKLFEQISALQKQIVDIDVKEAKESRQSKSER